MAIYIYILFYTNILTWKVTVIVLTLEKIHIQLGSKEGVVLPLVIGLLAPDGNPYSAEWNEIGWIGYCFSVGYCLSRSLKSVAETEAYYLRVVLVYGLTCKGSDFDCCL